jgi:hypothetical protein
MPSLSDLTDKHKGKIGFVIGAGPSLSKQIPLDVLKDYVTITVNSGIAAYFDCDMFVGDDQGLRWWDYYLHLLPKSKCLKLLYKAKLSDACSHIDKEELVFFDHKCYYDPSKKRYHPDGLVLTKSGPIIGSRTALGSAIHVAHVVGCDPIVLLGADCCYSKDNKRYFWQYWSPQIQPKRVTGEKAFCFPNHGHRDGYPIDSHCNGFLDYFEALAKQCEKQNINVINASGGILNSFPRMELDDVIKQYGV